MPMFINNPASFYWGILCIMVFFLAIENFAQLFFLGLGLLFTLIYIWSKYEPDALVSIYGGFTVKGAQLPFVYMGFTLLIGGSIYVNLLSVIAGELFFLLKEKAPHDYGWDVLSPPEFFTNLVTSRRNQPNVRFAGRGHRLD